MYRKLCRKVLQINYNRVFIKTNKIASVYGKEDLTEYIRREIEKGNLVRIKKRGPTSSESPAPIAVDYAGVTSAEEAADQTAMASYASNVAQKNPISQVDSILLHYFYIRLHRFYTVFSRLKPF